MDSLELHKRETCNVVNGRLYCSGIYRRSSWDNWGRPMFVVTLMLCSPFVVLILAYCCFATDPLERPEDTTELIDLQETEQDPQNFQPVPQQQFSHPYQHESAPPRGPPPPDYFSGQSSGNQGAEGGYHNPAGSANPEKDYAPPPGPSSAT